MKKIYKYIFAGFFAFNLASCNYLDIVPGETATEEDAFASTEAALRYLYSCYSYMPAHESTQVNISYAGDEFVSCFNDEGTQLYSRGGYSASNIGGVENTYVNMYKGIRQCYQLKANIVNVPGISKEKISDYTNQADFLIAYYHSILLQHYGPIILVKELPGLDTPAESYLGRSTYDECADWIAGEFKRLSELLPTERTGGEYGLATSVAALALRSRVLLYKASPLYNGNTDYKNFKNPDGTELISQTFDKNKYKEAADAALEAIEFAEDNGHKLYKIEDDNIGTNIAPYPKDPVQRQLRFGYVDKYGSKEILWANTRREYIYGLQSKSRPFMVFGGGYGPSITMVERFYTDNGLPIDEDPEFDYENRYGITTLSDDTRGEGKTLKLHDKREPRFYAWISFHNGFYECKTAKTQAAGQGMNSEGAYWLDNERSGGKNQRWLTVFSKNGNCGKGGRANNYSMTGYLNKKCVRPDLTAPAAEIAPSEIYPIPIIRLGELYLNYAEACVGYGDADYVQKGMSKLNEIRDRAGIDDVLTAWAKAKHPFSSYDAALQSGQLMDVVRRERMIELYMEGHNFWDARRWKIADKLFNEMPRGLNVDGETDEDFLKVVNVNQPREFISPTNYLMPIPNIQVSSNPQMVQNPGY